MFKLIQKMLGHVDIDAASCKKAQIKIVGGFRFIQKIRLVWLTWRGWQRRVWAGEWLWGQDPGRCRGRTRRGLRCALFLLRRRGHASRPRGKKWCNLMKKVKGCRKWGYTGGLGCFIIMTSLMCLLQWRHRHRTSLASFRAKRVSPKWSGSCPRGRKNGTFDSRRYRNLDKVSCRGKHLSKQREKVVEVHEVHRDVRRCPHQRDSRNPSRLKEMDSRSETSMASVGDVPGMNFIST